MRDALSSGDVAGAGPDVVVTLWAMWWFTVEGARALVGGATDLVNHPYGAFGTVLAPLSNAIFAAVRPLAGVAWANNAVGLFTLAGLASGTAWAARGLGVGWVPTLAAGVAVLVARYPVYALGETSVVGITALPFVFGVGAWIRRWRVFTAACAGLVALEYPYLVPVLPGLALLRAVRERDWRWGAVGIGGLLLAGLGTSLVGKGQSDSFGVYQEPYLVFLGRMFPAVDQPQARSELVNLLLPGPVRWTQDASASVHACGRDYLGLSVLVLALLGGRRAIPWVLLGLLGAALAVGSDYGGVPGLFSLLNLAAREVVRALTQPTRFLLLANVALGLAVALGVARMGRWGVLAVAALLIDALLVGGASLRMPTMKLPSAPCASALVDSTGVVLWPWDLHDNPESTIQVRLWQMVHGRPASTFGVGSWTLGQGKRAIDAIRRTGLAEQEEVPVKRLRGLGYDAILLDLNAKRYGDPVGVGAPVAECDGVEIYRLP